MAILNIVLQSLLEQIALAYGNLLPVAYYFFYSMATITLVKLGLAYALEPNGNILAQLIVKLFKIGLMLWLINDLPYLHEVLRDGAIRLGAKAAGCNNTLNLMLNPSAIAEYGITVIAPVRLWLHELSWSVKNIGSNIVNILFGVIAIIIILGAFFYLAYQVFMTLVDFYFTSILAPVFLAFQLFESTAWIAVGAIRGPIQHAVKLFTMTFIISLAAPWIGSLMVEHKQDFSEVGSLVLASVILVALSLKAGTWSAGMFTGSPTASAGDLVATSAAVVGAGVAGSMISGSLINQTKQLVGATARATIGGAIATGAAAITGAQLRGASYNSSNTSTQNSSIGKITDMAYGAAQGAFGVLTATPRAITERISQSFNEHVARGIREGYIATGGSNNIMVAKGNDLRDRSNYSDNYAKAAVDAAKQAKLYQRIANAFKEQQQFNQQHGGN